MHNHVKRNLLLLLWISPLLFNYSCSQKNSEEYINEIEHWRDLRIDYMKSENGFLNLAGLFWLIEGSNTIGADSSNTFVFPIKTEDRLGTLFLNNDSVWFIQNKSGLVKMDNGSSDDTTLVFVDKKVSVAMQHNDLKWFLIKRGVKYGIRLKDFDHPSLKGFDHIENYPIDGSWRVEATWEEYDTPKTVLLNNQVGMQINYPVKGRLKFTLKGEPYTLEPIETNEENLFVMIYDATSGKETYGSGRYLYVPRPVDKRTVIDFNKAYNPPCVYTEFATCLFPHEENRLPLEITVGEKYSGLH